MLKNQDKVERKKRRFKNERIKDVILLSALALLLCFAVWKIFFVPANQMKATTVVKTESEKALEELLSEIDGVGEVRVMICNDETGLTSSVIVCEGAKDIRVNTEVREAAATALGTDEKNVKIYLKKD